MLCDMLKQGLPAVIAERLQDWCFAVSEVFLAHLASLTGTEQQSALRAALTQLRALDAPGAVVSFTGWQWSQALADVLTEALPSLSHLKFNVPEVTHNEGEQRRAWQGQCVKHRTSRCAL